MISVSEKAVTNLGVETSLLIRRPLCGSTPTVRRACGLRRQPVTLQQLDISGSLRPHPDLTRAHTEDMSPLTTLTFRCTNIDFALKCFGNYAII